MIGRKVVPSGVVKHDTAAHWDAMDANENYTCTYVPQAGEIIVYDADSENENARMKVGDGQTIVALLPFTAGYNAGGNSGESGSAEVAMKRFRIVILPSDDGETDSVFWTRTNGSDPYTVSIQANGVTSEMALLEWEADVGYDFPWTVDYQTGLNSITFSSSQQVTHEIRGYVTVGADATAMTIDASASPIIVRFSISINANSFVLNMNTERYEYEISNPAIKNSMVLVEWEPIQDFPFDVSYSTQTGSVLLSSDEQITIPVSGTLTFGSTGSYVEAVV